MSDLFRKHMKKLDINIRLEVIQKTAVLGMASLLRKVLGIQDRTPCGSLGTCCCLHPRVHCSLPGKNRLFSVRFFNNSNVVIDVQARGDP